MKELSFLVLMNLGFVFLYNLLLLLTLLTSVVFLRDLPPLEAMGQIGWHGIGISLVLSIVYRMCCWFTPLEKGHGQNQSD